MHAMAALGALAFTAALSLPTMWFTDARADTAPLEDMEVIEASLAYKKPNTPKQPQKPRQQPNPEVKVEGVSRDETKKVDETKKDPKPDTKPADVVDPLAKYARPQDDTDVGKTDDREGSADGDELGRGNITKGDPYFQRLWVDLDWTVPELARTGGPETVACLVFAGDGTIPKTSFKTKGDDDIATLADAAIKKLQAKRNATPEEVPIHLLKSLTSKGICFNLTAK